MANVTLTPEVTQILNRSTIVENRLVLPLEQLDRKTYEAVNKVLVAAGGKWNKKERAHVFDGDPRPKLGLMLETGVAIDEKKKFQAFFTPREVAEKVVALADVVGQRVLEPSAGDGALADACLAAGADCVECIEVNSESVEELRSKNYSTTEADFLTVNPKPYSRIVMNPPFTKNQDIKHVAHALRFLAPNGILVAVMSPNINRSKFLELIDGHDHKIVDLPAGSFKESGTPIATIILKIIN